MKSKDDFLTAKYTGTSLCTSDNSDFDIHRMPSNVKAFVAVALEKGEGATEIVENVMESNRDIKVSTDSVYAMKHRLRQRNVIPDGWPRDHLQCLLLLRENQLEEISPELPVRGYIQVRRV